ncbi:unnamed protein product, partial [Prorocentrum cordatum]
RTERGAGAGALPPGAPRPMAAALGPESTLVAVEVAEQVRAYDERFLHGSRALAAGHAGAAEAQAQAFGRRDGTGVEAVHDVMPAEREAFERLVAEAARGKRLEGTGLEEPLLVLDFGCGDGRYLRQYLRTAEALGSRGDGRPGCRLQVVAYDVSVEALRSFSSRARAAGLSDASEAAAAPSPEPPGCPGSERRGLVALRGAQLEVEFALGGGGMDVHTVEGLLRARHELYDVIVVGWGTLSCIPNTPSLSAMGLLELFARAGRHVMNVASTTNNHVRFQREYAARRRAAAETDLPEARAWLQGLLGLATFEGSYYYPVDTGQRMFYAAVTAEQEVRICNIINFFDILTKPRAARLDAAVARLLQRGDLWGAQLLLSRGVARALERPLSQLRTSSCIFDASSPLASTAQVARYFISTGRGTSPARGRRPGAAPTGEATSCAAEPADESVAPPATPVLACKREMVLLLLLLLLFLLLLLLLLLLFLRLLLMVVSPHG